MGYNIDLISSLPFASVDHTPTMPVDFNDINRIAKTAVESEPQPAAKQDVPGRVHLVACIAYEYGVSQATAEGWLVAEFGSGK